MAQNIDLKVGFSCNNNCIHCVVSDKRQEPDLSYNELVELINNYISQYNKISLTLTGGEITNRRDFEDILRYIKTLKNSHKIDFIEIQTNGRNICKLEYFNLMIDTVDFFLIALHGPNSEIHDHITGKLGSFKETVSSIKKLISSISQNKVAIQTVINRINYKYLLNTYKFIIENLGITEVNITFPHPLGCCFSNKVVPEYFEVKDEINRSLITA